MTAFFPVLLAGVLPVEADTVQTRDGSRLVGEIIGIYEGTLTLETSFAGTLELEMDEIEFFESDGEESVRFTGGEVAVGVVRSPGPGQIEVESDRGVITGELDEVAAVWAPGEIDPQVAAGEADLRSQIRRWSYEAAVSLTGKRGNTVKGDYAASLRATLEGPRDRLEFYASYQYASAEDPATRIDSTTADELIGGVNYTSFFTEEFGWYVREEIERDKFENIEFRSTTAAGGTYRPLNRRDHSLEFFAGLSLRHESYGYDLDGDGIEDRTGSQSLPGLDFGLKHYWRFASWGELNNSITYNPAFEDFAEYRIDHLSTVDIPLGSSDFWKLRASLSNQYNSEPAAGAEELDTTYALSLLLNWK